jgi:mannosyl-3-phosphoglycerate phosphatase family protein
VARLILFSDIDGTLIDFADYSTRVAAPVVAQLAAQGIPLVLCSSKTAAEQLALRDELGIPDPFIVENGSAIFVPEGYFPAALPSHPTRPGWQVMALGVDAAHIRATLAEIRGALGLTFQGYGDLSVAEVARITGLAEDAARRARQREYSETLVTPLSPQELAALAQALAQRGLAVVSGGKFHTVMGGGSDKGRAVKLLTDLYRAAWGDVRTIGLGDSANDLPLLAGVDRAYLVQKPDGSWQPVAHDLPVERVPAIGPAGWRHAVLGELAKR